MKTTIDISSLRRLCRAAPLALLLGLAACGGGGGGGDLPSTQSSGTSTGTGSGSNTGGHTGDNTGGNTGGDTGGNTGGDTGGNTGGDTGGNTGGDTGGNTGGDTGNPPPGPEVVGQWSNLLYWPQVGVHLQLLPNGNVLSWAYRFDDHDETNSSKQVFEVRVPTGADPELVRRVDNTTTNIACSGFTLLSDGRMLVAGGEGADGGLAANNIYDFSTGTWTRIADGNGKRWYPTTTTLANGEVLMTGGLIDFATESINPLPQVWSSISGWRDLTNAVANDVGVYPRMHLAPNGKVFKSGMQVWTRYLDPTGTGQWTDVGQLNHRAGRDYGTSVMFGPGQVLALGGGDPPTNTAELINLNDANPAWQYTNPMRFARRHLNATLLADGKILVTGGTSSPGFNDATNAAMAAEMWDPATARWSTMANMATPRVYHSTALLLPDGRVLAAGGGDPAPVNGSDNVSSQIYSPPYLFKGARPRISSAPSVVAYGARFTVGTPDAASITRATFIRLGSVTHAFNNSQRIAELSFTTTANGLQVLAPSDRNLVPPGHYMLFLLNADGVPSVSRIVQIL